MAPDRERSIAQAAMYNRLEEAETVNTGNTFRVVLEGLRNVCARIGNFSYEVLESLELPES